MTQHRNPLIEYQKLDMDEKTVLQASALIHHGYRTKDLLELFLKSEIYTQKNELFSSDYLKKLINKLTEQEILYERGASGDIGHFALKEAVRDGRFMSFFWNVQNRWPLRIKDYMEDFCAESNYFERDARYLFYCQKAKELRKLCAAVDEYETDDRYEEIITDIAAGIPDDPDWLLSLPKSFFELVTGYQLQTYPIAPKSYSNTLSRLEKNLGKQKFDPIALANYYILTGDLNRVMLIIIQLADEVVESNLFRGTFCFLTGDIPAALVHYQTALKQFRKETEANMFFTNLHGVFFLMALIKTDELDKIDLAERLAKDGINTCLTIWGSDTDYGEIFEGLLSLAHFIKTGEKYFNLSIIHSAVLRTFFWVLCCRIDPDDVKAHLDFIKEDFQAFEQTEYSLLSCVYAEILKKYAADQDKKFYQKYLEKNQKLSLSFLNLLQKTDYWKRALDEIQTFTDKQSNIEKEKRLIFLLDFENSFEPITPAVQISKKNGWSKGKKLYLSSLAYRLDEMDWLTGTDERICRVLSALSDEHEFVIEETVLPMLVGHPQLYLNKYPDIKVELEKSAPELLVEEKGDNILVKFLTPIDGKSVVTKKETHNHYKLVEIKKAHVDLHRVLTNKGLIIPKEGKEQFLDSLKNIMDFVTVYSSMPIDNMPVIEGNPALQAQLSPFNQGLRLDLLVRPLGDRGPLKWPGEGEPIMLTVQNGEKVQIKRDLEQERQSVKELISACPSLKKDEETIKTEFPTPAESLELLSEIKTYDKPLQIVWPSGELFKIKAKLSFEHLSLKVSSRQDWFEVKGNVKLDSKTLLDMNELLELIDDSSNRLVQLKDGEFLCLTEHFKKQLQQLKRLTKSDGSDLRIHKLGACALDDVICDFDDVELDEKWNEQIEKMQSVKKINPQIPVNLEAKLRPYQEEGYKWLCRLENLGVGACLADDMGLGKTVQAIAVLLKNASKGSSLVVAPTSVCHNWLSEISRFAPTLNPILFSEIDRKNVEKILKKNDVLICSYALLNNSADTLTKISWQVSVLDEAQSIKNATTKRAKAAFELQSKFRIALTGTPIENHLGELWSLFRFLNPGFLGSEKTFFSQFVAPIEKEKSIPAREALKKMIQPFMLRRTKNSVLDSLPPRIEKSLEVDLSTKEAAFYEALRQKAVKNISDMTENAGKKRIKILAEITKLRQACCHPSLVKPEIGIKSSKLSYFENLLQEILENGHKVLVFSQFVRYLKMVCDLLDKQKISYQYLDGSTPAKQRREFITNFQNGDGSVFLLSLKAGGIGINLTAADYVILLDPWWNPAVEDQAADRAHRIGQTKPVTIYRLINKNTIEEKIIALHQQKRNLASDLLSGTNMTGKLSEEQLIELMSVV